MYPTTPQACGVCGCALNFMVGHGWLHPEDLDADHVAVPVDRDQIRLMGRCDLCGASPVVAQFTSEPITMYGIRGADTGATMVASAQMDAPPVGAEALGSYDADWGCCAVCARLVRKNRWEQLLDRCVNAIAAAQHEGTIPAGLRDTLAALHHRLRETITGPPRPT